MSPVELVETYLERIERLDPELGAFVTVCGEQALADARAKADAPAETPFHGVPIALKDLDTTAGIRTTFSCKRVRGERPRLRPRPRRPDARGRLRRPRQDEHARVRHDGLHRLAAERPLPDAVGPRQERGRLERRRGGSRRGRARSDRAGLRRRRLDPHPGLVLRALRDQGLTRPRLERAVRAGHRARHRRRRSRGRRCDAAAYLDLVTGYEWGDPFPAAPPERPYVEEIGVESGPAPDRLHDRGADRHGRRSRLRRRCPRRRRAARLARPRRRGGCARLGRRGADGGLPACLAGDPGALPDRRPDRALGAEPVVSRARARRRRARSTRARSAGCSCERAGSSSFWADYDLLLTPTLAHAARAARVGHGARRSRASSSTAPPRSRRSRPCSTSPASRPCHCRCTGRTTGSRSGFSSWGLRSARRSSSGSRRSSRRRGRGSPDGLLTPDRRKKDVRDGVTAPRTSLWGGDLQTAAAAAT